MSTWYDRARREWARKYDIDKCKEEYRKKFLWIR